MKVYDLRILILTLLPIALFSERIQPEAYYQKIAAARYDGQTEVTMPDGTRCDIITEKHAIEVDFADKWAEAIGQSLNYGFQTNKRPGILLIIETRTEEKHLIRVKSLIRHYELQIDVFAIRAWEHKEL